MSILIQECLKVFPLGSRVQFTEEYCQTFNKSPQSGRVIEIDENGTVTVMLDNNKLDFAYFNWWSLVTDK